MTETMPGPAAAPPPPIGRYFELSTEAVDPAQRFAFWRETVLNRSDPDRPASNAEQPFSGRLRCFAGTTAQIRVGDSAPIIMRRTRTRCRRDGGDEFLISACLELEGDGRALQAGAPELPIAPDRIMLLDMAQPFEVRVGRYRELNFRLPRGAVAAAIGGDPARLGGRPMPASPFTELLLGQLRLLADALPRLGDQARQAALDATTALALSALRIECGTGAAEPELPDDGLWAAAERFIAFHFGRHDLSPTTLARALRCSRSHLYRVFERRDLTVMGHVLAVRLRRGRALLCAPGCRLSVSEIAYLCGFADTSSFTRSFKRRYGLPPSELRRQALGDAGEP